MVRRKSKFRKDGIRKHESHATFFEFQSKMSDGDYVPGPDQIVPNIGGQKKRVKKTTILSKCWPEIKKLSEKGTGPHDIATILNAKLKPQDHLDGKQISNKISRMKNQGSVKLNVSKTSGSLKASSKDCVFFYMHLT